MKKYILLLPALMLLILGCSQESTNPNTDPETGVPEILGISAEKTQILYGGQDPAIITCNATGGNLKYVWEVDLGDIIPLNASHSKISFNGSACCVGEKIITCTVSNSQGSVSKSIVITILEVENPPEIISLESNKTELHSSTGESASLVCYAIGGSLKYAWETDCGELNIDAADSSRATLTATPDCAGMKNIKCTVSNGKGTDVKTVQISVVN
jgi:putative hemolysin